MMTQVTWSLGDRQPCWSFIFIPLSTMPVAGGISPSWSEMHRKRLWEALSMGRRPTPFRLLWKHLGRQLQRCPLKLFKFKQFGFAATLPGSWPPPAPQIVVVVFGPECEGNCMQIPKVIIPKSWRVAMKRSRSMSPAIYKNVMLIASWVSGLHGPKVSVQEAVAVALWWSVGMLSWAPREMDRFALLGQLKENAFEWFHAILNLALQVVVSHLFWQSTRKWRKMSAASCLSSRTCQLQV